MFEAVDSHLQNEITRGTFPGVQYVIGERGKIVAEKALGFAVVEPEQIPATTRTIYDLASLTKPLVTALLTVTFAERGLVDLAAPVGDYLEGFHTPDKSGITVTALLTHTSGLAAWRPLYLETQNRDDIPLVIARTPQPAEPGQRVIYSDLNFILLGFILERVAGARLDLLAEKEIFAPLGLARTMFNPPAGLRREIAATECGQAHERKTVAETEARRAPRDIKDRVKSPRPLRRKEVIWGEVHDGNAYFMDGVAGHAGLFATAREVFLIAGQFLPQSRLLRRESLSLFTTNFTAGRGGARSIGWVLAATEDFSAGAAMPPESFGHTGFTGTSVWIDPAKERVFVLLTNRVHPQARDLGMKQARQNFHTLSIRALNSPGAL